MSGNDASPDAYQTTIENAIAKMPIHHLVFLTASPYEKSHVDAIMEEAGLPSDSNLCFLSDELERELKSRLMRMDATSEVFGLVVDNLLSTAIACVHAYRQRGAHRPDESVLVVLFHVSHKLTPLQLKRFGRALNMRMFVLSSMLRNNAANQDDIPEVPEFEYRSFGVHVEAYKKHPQSLLMSNQLEFVEYASASWFGEHNAVVATDMLRCMVRSRYALSEPSRACLRTRLFSGYVDLVKGYSRFWAARHQIDSQQMEEEIRRFERQVERCRRLLSRASMRWLRIRFRVRVFASLSLLFKEAKERMYAPGGSGYEQAMKRLKQGKDGYADEL